MTKDLQPTEKEFFLLLEQKNEDASNYLYDRYSPLVYGIIVRQVKNEKIAAEILKRSFITIFRECKKIECLKQPLFSWLLLLTQKTITSSLDYNIKYTPEAISQNDGFNSVVSNN